MQKTEKSKSPLKDKPLRNPGQSLDEAIEKKINDEALIWVFAVVFTLVMAGLEWYRSLTQQPYSPITYSIIAALVTAVGVWKVRKILKDVRRLKLGRDGEKAVGQYLEALREHGYRVFHDIVGEGFNIDHVVIGPTGVYSIETKTFSKPPCRDSQIAFDGKTITKNGFELERDPVIQARAQAKWLAELLKASSGRKVKVKPVILFPGWYVESKGSSDVWVLNPKALEAFMAHCETQHSKEDVRLFSFHLSRIIRTQH